MNTDNKLLQRNKQTNKQTNRQADKQTSRQTDWQTGEETNNSLILKSSSSTHKIHLQTFLMESRFTLFTPTTVTNITTIHLCYTGMYSHEEIFKKRFLTHKTQLHMYLHLCLLECREIKGVKMCIYARDNSQTCVESWRCFSGFYVQSRVRSR